MIHASYLVEPVDPTGGERFMLPNSGCVTSDVGVSSEYLGTAYGGAVFHTGSHRKNLTIFKLK